MQNLLRNWVNCSQSNTSQLHIKEFLKSQLQVNCLKTSTNKRSEHIGEVPNFTAFVSRTNSIRKLIMIIYLKYLTLKNKFEN